MAKVDTQKLQLITRELVDRCGSLDKTAEYIGISRQTILRVYYVELPTTQERVARCIILGLHEKRKEDRRNGSSDRFRQARRKQAVLEERLERLTGY